MSTQVAYSFTQVVGSTVRDQSGYLYDLALAGGTGARGRWDTSGSTGGMNCASGGGTCLMTKPDGGVSELMLGLGGTQFGVLMWVKANAGATGQQVLFHAGAPSSTSVDYFTVYAADNSGKVAFRHNGVTTTTAVSILDGGWHSVSVQSGGDLNSGGVVVKVDDVVVGTAAATSGSNIGTYTTFALGQTCGGTLPFNGVIDDVRILNDPIDWASGSTSNSGFLNAPVLNQLTVQYAFSEGTGTTARDTSGHGFDATLTKADRWSASGEHGGSLNVGDSAAVGNPFGSASIALDTTDRVTVMHWVFIPTSMTGGTYTLFDIRDSSGNLRFESLVQGNVEPANVYFRVYNASHTQWISSLNFSIPHGQWHHVAVTMFPTGYQPTLDGVNFGGASGMAANPYSAWDKINFGAGRFAASSGVLIDDLRIVNNYLYPEATLRQMATGDAAPPTAVENVHAGAAAPSGMFVGSASVSSLYVGGTKVYG